MRITMEELQIIIAGGTIETPPQGARYLDAEGVWHNGYPTSAESGAFTGRAGTMRRSRKGRSFRNSNGRREFIAGDGSVLAYVPKPVV